MLALSVFMPFSCTILPHGSKNMVIASFVTVIFPYVPILQPQLSHIYYQAMSKILFR